MGTRLVSGPPIIAVSPSGVWRVLHRKLDVAHPHYVGPVGVLGVHEIEHLTRDHGELVDVGGPVAATLQLGELGECPTVAFRVTAVLSVSLDIAERATERGQPDRQEDGDLTSLVERVEQCAHEGAGKRAQHAPS